MSSDVAILLCPLSLCAFVLNSEPLNDCLGFKHGQLLKNIIFWEEADLIAERGYFRDTKLQLPVLGHRPKSAFQLICNNIFSQEILMFLISTDLDDPEDGRRECGQMGRGESRETFKKDGRKVKKMCEIQGLSGCGSSSRVGRERAAGAGGGDVWLDGGWADRRSGGAG